MIKKLFFLAVMSSSTICFAQKISIIPSVGFGWRTADDPDNISGQDKEYLKGLKNGMVVDISAYYHFKGNFALGLKLSNYSASSSATISVNSPNNYPMSQFISTSDNITFFGPAVMYSNFNETTKHKLFVDMGLGVISYTTKTGNIKGTGSNLGVEMNFGYQYAISKHLFLGPKLGLTGGTLSKMSYNGKTVDFGDTKEGLGRVSLSLAATFHL